MPLFGVKKSLGVDVGTSSIKIAELSKSSGRYKLENYGIVDVGRNEAVFAEVMQKTGGKPPRLSEEEAAGGIREILNSAKIQSREAVVSLPAYLAFSTVITMPYASEDEISNAINFEARKYVPVPLSDVILDWSLISVLDNSNQVLSADDSKNNAAYVEVFLVAVPKQEIERYKNIMKMAGLDMKVLETEGFAIIRSLVGNDLSPVAIVNVGNKSTSIMVVDRGFERINFDFSVGGFEVMKAISQSMNLDLVQAENVMKKNGLLPDNPAIADVIGRVVDKIINEVKRVVQNYENSRNVKTTKTILIGGLANMPNFIGYFGNLLGGNIELGNSLARVITPPEVEPVKNDLSSKLAVSVGLAMRDF